MELERVATLVKRLLENTRAGKIEWREETTGVFTTVVGQHVVFVLENDDPSGDPWVDPDYVVGIRRLDGNVWVDSFADEELQRVLPNSFKLMQELYRGARRSARGIDGILDQLLKDIE